MGKDPKHPEAKPMTNAVKLLVRNPHDLYVPGDTISGELLLEVSRGELTVSKMMVCMKCIETCKLEIPGTIEFDNTRHIYGLDLTYMIGERIGHGTHKVPFNYTIDEVNSSLPPSASFESLGDKVSGVRWYLKAVVELSDPKNTRMLPKTLTDSMLISFYPTKYVKHDDEKSAIFNVGSMDVGLKMPQVLQQAPRFLNIEITMLPLEPTMVHSVTITLCKTVVLWGCKNSRVLTESERIGQVDIGKVLTKKLTIDGVSQGWRARDFMTPAFTSSGTNLCYTLLVSVLLSKSHKFGFSLVDFVSPSFERCQKRETENNDARESPPPSYSALSGE